MEQILREGFAALGLPLTDEALSRYQRYYAYLSERSQVMNLTAIHGEAETARLHFLDCAALLALEKLDGASVIDVGSGAGFPGLPMKIACPSLRALEQLCQRCLDKGRRRAKERYQPHPEDGPGAAHGNGRRHTCQVPRADACRH